MADYLNPQDLANAKVDAKTLGDAVNEKKIIKPRYGDSYKSIPMLSADGESSITELNKAIEIALAAGAGDAGWDASLVHYAGSTQAEFNKKVTTNGAALPWMSNVEYALHAPVTKSDGTLVQSTVAGNKTNPNVNMTGWKVPSLKTADNLSDVPNKAAARSNLSVYSQAEVDTAISNATPTIPNATETVAGKAKIATTAIAQAGVNDADFLTPKKLRDALNATGGAPIFACRAWVNFNGAGTVKINASGNVSGITRNGVGDYTINFTEPMQHADYVVLGINAEYSNGVPIIITTRTATTGFPLLKTTQAVRISTRAAGDSIFDIKDISIGIIC